MGKGRADLGFSYWWRGCIGDRNRDTKLLRDIPDELKDYDPLPWHLLALMNKQEKTQKLLSAPWPAKSRIGGGFGRKVLN